MKIKNIVLFLCLKGFYMFPIMILSGFMVFGVVYGGLVGFALFHVSMSQFIFCHMNELLVSSYI